MFTWLKNCFARTDDSETGRRTMVRKRRTVTKVGDPLVVQVGPSCWPAKVEDIHSNGIGVVVGFWHKAGTSISIKLRNQKTNYARQADAHVARTVLCGDGKWLLGCSFKQPLTRNEMDMLLAS